MKIKRLYINNFKSLVNFELVEPNAFSVFVGPNAAGKSNVFEALEFLKHWFLYSSAASELFDGPPSFVNKKCAYIPEQQTHLVVEVDWDEMTLSRDITIRVKNKELSVGFHGRSGVIEAVNAVQADKLERKILENEKDYSARFLRLFIGKEDLVRLKMNGIEKLRSDAKNLEAVLWRLFQQEEKREEITEWLQLLIPEFKEIEVSKIELTGEYVLTMIEKQHDEPFKKKLLSDGTYNILALLTAVYQSDEPQFLCIEEPENGLNPYVIRTLVEFFRNICEEKGHYIWLNTHSPMLVKCLQPKELILIDKIEGITRAKQIDPNLKFKSMPLDEAWLTNTLGGGLPW